MKDFLKFIFAVGVFLYVIVSVASLAMGHMGGGIANEYNECYDTPTRMQRLFPSYRLGCYMASPIDQEYYDYYSLQEFNKKSYNPWEE